MNLHGNLNESIVAPTPSYLNIHISLHKISNFKPPEVDKNYIHPIIRSDITLVGRRINTHSSATSSNVYPKVSCFDKPLLV